jgi:hypothetical protein
MYNSWRNIAPCDMANYLAYLRTQKDNNNLADVRTKTAEAAERVSRIPQNLPDQQPNEWIKVNGKWVVSPENYND